MLALQGKKKTNFFLWIVFCIKETKTSPTVKIKHDTQMYSNACSLAKNSNQMAVSQSQRVLFKNTHSCSSARYIESESLKVEWKI